MRMVWTAGGWVAFGFGLVGVILPLLPTVPFMLLAAFCFARGSDRFHRWLMTHSRFGPPIHDWYERGAIGPAAKRAATLAILGSFLLSLALGVPGRVLAIQGVALGLVLAFVLTRPGGSVFARAESRPD